MPTDIEPFITLRDLWVDDCSSKEANRFVVQNHYTHSVKGITPSHCFLVRNQKLGEIVGAAIFGISGQVQTTNRWSENGTIRVVELRRFVLLDACPKNSESITLGVMFRLLRKAGVQRVISYADPNEKREAHPDGNHTGLIYRATGFHKFKDAGTTSAIWYKERRWPVRNIDQYNNYSSEPAGWDKIPNDKKILRGKPGKPVWVPKIDAERTARNKELRAALADGTAVMRAEQGKIGYVKDLVKGMEYFDTPAPKKDAAKFVL